MNRSDVIRTLAALPALVGLILIISSEAIQRESLRLEEVAAVEQMVEHGCAEQTSWWDPAPATWWACPAPYLSAAYADVAFGTTTDLSGWNSVKFSGGLNDVGCVIKIQMIDEPCEPDDCAVTVCHDGTVIYKEAPDPGSVTEQFWETLAAYRPRCVE